MDLGGLRWSNEVVYLMDELDKNTINLLPCKNGNDMQECLHGC